MGNALLSVDAVRLNRNVYLARPIKKSPENISFTGSALPLPHIHTPSAKIRPIFHTNATDNTRLGANYNPATKNVDFKLASNHATAAILCVFDKPEGEDAVMNIQMRKGKSNIWEASIPYNELGNKPFYYGYRVFGPNWEFEDGFFDENGKVKDPQRGFKSIVDEYGNRFNPNKIAHDPYSKELSHLPAIENVGDLRYFSSNLLEDSAKYAPKSVFSITPDEVIPGVKPRTLLDEVIGEVHIKDLTINENVKGAGGYLGAKNFAKKLKETGITMVEFLPLQEYDHNSGQNNYWGYMTLGFFAPAKRYAFDKTPGGALKEFREMIKEFHKNDIKVCMDVVYNHTGEGTTKDNNPNDARQFSFSLIDNQSYYKSSNGYYTSNTGCSNDINIAHEQTMDFVADSIAYWANQGVDAFRFDLAAGLMDVDPSANVHFDPYKSFVGKITELLAKRGIKVNKPNESGKGIHIIAEPWTCCGKNAYQIGNFPEPWAQWNDIAREGIKKDSMDPFSITPRQLRNILEGSHDIFGDGDRSINYVYSHDGFCLYDNNTVSAYKANDYGGDADRQLIAMKKQIALLLLAKGTPMLQIGDLIAHSKKGNSNSYNQDNEINHLDFSKTRNPDSVEGQIYNFSRRMINFRKAHPFLTDSAYNKNITYYKPDGSIAQDWDGSYWNNIRSNIMCYKIDSQDSLFISTSSDENSIDVVLPEPKPGKKWHLVCDTSQEDSFCYVKMKENKFLQSPHSIMIFEER